MKVKVRKYNFCHRIVRRKYSVLHVWNSSREPNGRQGNWGTEIRKIKPRRSYAKLAWQKVAPLPIHTTTLAKSVEKRKGARSSTTRNWGITSITSDQNWIAYNAVRRTQIEKKHCTPSLSKANGSVNAGIRFIARSARSQQCSTISDAGQVETVTSQQKTMYFYRIWFQDRSGGPMHCANPTNPNNSSESRSKRINLILQIPLCGEKACGQTSPAAIRRS